MTLQQRIEAAITEQTGSPSRIINSNTASGGCINDSQVITLEDGRVFFMKTNPRATQLPGLFETEYLALKLLSEANAIQVPAPVCYDEDFIVIECFEQGSPAKDWQEQMGQQLAQLHHNTQQQQFGFNKQNYLGTTPQPNDWCDDWLTFYCEHRLGWQLQCFADKTSADDPLLQLGDKLMQKLDSLLGNINEPAVLLHGDLWSGNAAATKDGAPVIFDPASYYGHREAEIGMMRLFGGFGPRCEAAYAEVWPLEPGSEQRITLYRLYHELNHLNLFGSGYYSTCVSTLRSLL